MRRLAIVILTLALFAATGETQQAEAGCRARPLARIAQRSVQRTRAIGKAVRARLAKRVVLQRARAFLRGCR